jgi:hypothetical protein
MQIGEVKGLTSDGKVDVIDSSSEDVDADDGSGVLGERLESYETGRHHKSDVAELDLSYNVHPSSVRERERRRKGRELTERSVDDDGGVSRQHERRSVRCGQIGRELRERTANPSIVSLILARPQPRYSQVLIIGRSNSQRRERELQRDLARRSTRGNRQQRRVGLSHRCGESSDGSPVVDDLERVGQLDDLETEAKGESKVGRDVRRVGERCVGVGSIEAEREGLDRDSLDGTEGTGGRGEGDVEDESGDAS